MLGHEQGNWQWDVGWMSLFWIFNPPILLMYLVLPQNRITPCLMLNCDFILLWPVTIIYISFIKTYFFSLEWCLKMKITKLQFHANLFWIFREPCTFVDVFGASSCWTVILFCFGQWLSFIYHSSKNNFLLFECYLKMKWQIWSFMLL